MNQLTHAGHCHVDIVAAEGRVQTAGEILARGGNDQAVDVEEQVFGAAVVGCLRNVCGPD
jgi:hypothetical protein